MDYRPLWLVVKEAMASDHAMVINSSHVADVLGTDRVSRSEVESVLAASDGLRLRFEFRNLTDDHRWDLALWRDQPHA